MNDLNNDGEISPEEKAARKVSRKADADARRADREDDGIVNGSAGDDNAHGKSVSDIAKDETLEGREKGQAVSEQARSKARRGEKHGRTHVRKPENGGRQGGGKPTGIKPSGGGKHTGGRPAGAGRSGK